MSSSATTVEFLIAAFGRWRAYPDDPSSMVFWNYKHQSVRIAYTMDQFGIYTTTTTLFVASSSLPTTSGLSFMIGILQLQLVS